MYTQTLGLLITLNQAMEIEPRLATSWEFVELSWLRFLPNYLGVVELKIALTSKIGLLC